MLPTPANTCAVFVAYHPGPELARAISAMRGQVEHLCVIDNTPHEGSGGPPSWSIEGIEYLPNRRNLGVGVALNQGVAAARRMGCDWVLTLDQDSMPGPELFDGLRVIAQRASVGVRIGCIGAGFEGNAGDGCDERHGVAFREVRSIVTSGMLLPLAVLDVVGGFWDALFIDGVDTELCLRLRRSGFTVLRGCRPLMRHRIGAAQPRYVLGRALQCNHHPPSRRYYIARNRIHLARRHPSLRLLYELLRDDVAAVAFEPERLRKWRACILGAYDGLRGVLGECERSL